MFELSEFTNMDMTDELDELEGSSLKTAIIINYPPGGRGGGRNRLCTINYKHQQHPFIVFTHETLIYSTNQTYVTIHFHSINVNFRNRV